MTDLLLVGKRQWQPQPPPQQLPPPPLAVVWDLAEPLPFVELKTESWMEFFLPAQ
jgi:hypothetical protein